MILGMSVLLRDYVTHSLNKIILSMHTTSLIERDKSLYMNR
jgi:hypothetical protein